MGWNGMEWNRIEQNRIEVVEQRTDLTSTWQQPVALQASATLCLVKTCSKLLCAGEKWLIGFLGVLHHLFSVPPVWNQSLIAGRSKNHPTIVGKKILKVNHFIQSWTLAWDPQNLTRIQECFLQMILLSERKTYTSQYRVNDTQLCPTPHSFDIDKCQWLQSVLPGCNFMRLRQCCGPGIQMALVLKDYRKSYRNGILLGTHCFVIIFYCYKQY